MPIGHCVFVILARAPRFRAGFRVDASGVFPHGLHVLSLIVFYFLGGIREEMGGPTGVAALGAPGGPLFVPGFVSGCLSVQELQRSWHTLIAALESDSRAIEAQDDDVDVTVEDLKVVTDAQVVDEALMCGRQDAGIKESSYRPSAPGV